MVLLRSCPAGWCQPAGFLRVEAPGRTSWSALDSLWPLLLHPPPVQAKASIAVYRDIITHGGFPEDNTRQTCRFTELREPCSVCTWMFNNKAMLVFGGCLLITAVMLAALVIFVVITKRSQTRDRRRGLNRVNRRRRREGVPVLLCPPVKY